MEELRKETIPWQKREELGFFRAFWETIKQVLSKPNKFFENLEIKDSLLEPFYFYFLISLVSYSVAIIPQTLLPLPKLSTVGKEVVFILLFVPGSLIAIGIIISLSIFIIATTTHLGVMLFAGKNRSGFKATFNALAYSFVPIIFIIIPFVGCFIMIIWTSILGIISLKKVHKTSIRRVFLIYAGHGFFIFLFVILFAIALYRLK